MTTKRIFDVVFSFLAVILLLPLFAVIALLIKLTSKGPVLFCQCRIGLNQKEFTILKFRTMRDGTGHPGVDLTSKDDPRITEIGGFLRQSRLDELPQFFNVLQGDMSIVGPRPYEITSARQFSLQVPSSMCRYVVKPGITGLAQVHGRKGKKPEDLKNDLDHDLEYIRRQSLALDLVICLKTIPVVLAGKGI